MKKDIDYYMKLPYTVIVEPYDGGFGIKIKELKGCVAWGKTKAEAMRVLKIHKKMWLEAAFKMGLDIPELEGM
jgi:predicted RNase H-like HicB family nuclease